MFNLFKSSFQNAPPRKYMSFIVIYTKYRKFKNKSCSIPAVLRVDFSFTFLFIFFDIKVCNFVLSTPNF